jgi:3-dehydroquinate dehydratase
VIYNGTGSGKIAEGKAPGGQAEAKAAALAHVSIAIADAAREAK